MAERPLRIALLTHSVNPRGGVVHTLELAEALQAAGHEVTVMAPAAPGEAFFRAVSCRVALAPAAPASRDTAAMVASRIDSYVTHLTVLLRRCGFDVLHAQDGISGNALATLRERGVIGRFVRTVHHLDDFVDARLAAWQCRAFSAADQVLCVSRTWRDELLRSHGIRAAQVPNGVDLRCYSPQPSPGDVAVARRLGVGPSLPVVLSVGGVEERKNTLRLLEAVGLLRAQGILTQLVIAGGASLLDHGAYSQRFADALRDIDVGGSVRVLGPVADADMPALYRLASVVAMPSLREGFGLAALEGLASGTPTLVSRLPPFTEHFAVDDVFWADPLDAGSIAEAVAHALTTPKFDPPSVCQRFDWRASAREHVALYRSGLEAGRMKTKDRPSLWSPFEGLQCPR